MKKVRRSICLFLASCMIMSVLCFTASAESGTYNNRTYTISLSLGRRAMTSQLSYPTSIQLGRRLCEGFLCKQWYGDKSHKEYQSA